MSKSSAILLSMVLSVLSGMPALAQYDPRLPAQGTGDGLDSVYDRINAEARQAEMGPTGVAPAPRDARAYNQFMNQTQKDIDYEYNNTARIEGARARDARTTQAYETKRISDLAAWEKSQLTTYTSINGRHGSYNGATISAADRQGVEERKRVGLLQADDAMNTHLRDSQNAATVRAQAIQDSANNLRDQLLNQPSDKAFGLQGIGTNLYVRQYGKPDAVLPPVHNAAARIVPAGGDY